jgi:hypothetical protein
MQSPETKKSNYQAKSIANKIIRLIYVFLLLSIDSTKMIQINKFMGLTGSGDSYQIRIVADEAKGRFEDKKFSQRELRNRVQARIYDGVMYR